jgi:ribulose 1,5-bisphosphate synthetase/thiazole synthase
MPSMRDQMRQRKCIFRGEGSFKMARKYDFDLVVLGAGSGGLVAAVGATKLGLTVALGKRGSPSGATA